MIDGNTLLVVIPARGGSKRLPRKNISNLAGKPLVAWTIEAGLKSKYADEVMVSTDDPTIADISQKYGAKVPFLRPEKLSNDTASSFAVVEHAIDFYKNQLNKEFDYIILLQPTSPLRDYLDVDNAVELLRDKKADAIISVTRMEHSPLWANTIPANLTMESFLKQEIINKRSQDLPQYYRLNGAIYLCQTQRLLQEKSFFIKDNIFAYIMLPEKSTDIDTELDLKFCEFLLDKI